MNKALERVRAIGAHAWLTFLQQLNALLVSVLGGILVVNTTYPDVIRSLLAKLPPIPAAIALGLLGFLVHYSARRAKKAGE